MTFTEQLAAAWQKNNSLLCVGLDPDPAKFPAHLQGRDDAIVFVRPQRDRIDEHIAATRVFEYIVESQTASRILAI